MAFEIGNHLLSGMNGVHVHGGKELPAVGGKSCPSCGGVACGAGCGASRPVGRAEAPDHAILSPRARALLAELEAYDTAAPVAAPAELAVPAAPAPELYGATGAWEASAAAPEPVAAPEPGPRPAAGGGALNHPGLGAYSSQSDGAMAAPGSPAAEAGATPRLPKSLYA